MVFSAIVFTLFISLDSVNMTASNRKVHRENFRTVGKMYLESIFRFMKDIIINEMKIDDKF